MTTATFDNVEIKNVEPFKMEQTVYSMKCEIKGATSNFADITALIAKAGPPTRSHVLQSGYTGIQTFGTKGSLVVVGGGMAGTYTNCVIMDGVPWEEVRGTGGSPWYKYSVKIEQETK